MVKWSIASFRVVRSVVAVDPEPDMLVRARRAASDQGVINVSWMLGTDTNTGCTVKRCSAPVPRVP